MTHTHNTHTHAHPQSSTLRAPWLLERGLLIDQSALTAVWREPLTLWLQRVCVQCPCKGSLAPTLGVSALPWRRWHTHTHMHTHTHGQHITTHTRAGGAGGGYTPRQSPSGMHSHRAVSVCIQSGRWRHRQVLPPVPLYRSTSVCPRLAPPSRRSQGEQVQRSRSWNTD